MSTNLSKKMPSEKNEALPPSSPELSPPTTRKRKPKSSSGKSMADESMRFVLILPPDVSKLFAKEMEKLDRKKLPLARYIVTKYFEDKGESTVATVEAPKKQDQRSPEPQTDLNLWRLMGRRATDHIPRNLP